jgi:hypothetical protein
MTGDGRRFALRRSQGRASNLDAARTDQSTSPATTPFEGDACRRSSLAKQHGDAVLAELSEAERATPPSTRAALDTIPKWSYPYGAAFGLVPRHEASPLNSGASGREG